VDCSIVSRCTPVRSCQHHRVNDAISLNQYSTTSRIAATTTTTTATATNAAIGKM
jgi:hypothetical protein